MTIESIPQRAISNSLLESVLKMRGFRLHPYEAAHLHMSDSVRLAPGDDFAAIIGVLHNLHCLVKSPPPLICYLKI